MIIAEVLAIIRLSLELALEIVKSIPESERAEFWARHNERMAWWHAVAKKLEPLD